VTPNRDAAQAAADFLNRCHEREGKLGNPQHLEAELRTHLRVCCNAAWIVVCRSGNQAGPRRGQQISDRGVFGESPLFIAEDASTPSLLCERRARLNAIVSGDRQIE